MATLATTLTTIMTTHMMNIATIAIMNTTADTIHITHRDIKVKAVPSSLRKRKITRLTTTSQLTLKES